MGNDRQALLRVDQLRCRIGGQLVVDELSFALHAGELGALLGPSGCGKTTALRAIAGFEQPESGSITLRGSTIANALMSQPAEQRRIGFVFQDLALFPHLDVAGNIAFGLRGLAAQAREARVEQWLDRLELQALRRRLPGQLSGGQQQRVAVARALAPQPDLLLLDEPFSSLDAGLRVRLRSEIRDLLRSLGVAALLVTHDQDEAFAFAAQVGVMRAGRLQQWATPFEVYHRPATPFVAAFVGEGGLLPGIVEADGSIDTALGRLRPQGPLQQPGAKVNVLLRPDDIRLDPSATLRAHVVNSDFRGAETLYRLRLADGTLIDALWPSHHALQVGAQIGIDTDLEHVVAFAAPATQ